MIFTNPGTAADVDDKASLRTVVLSCRSCISFVSQQQFFVWSFGTFVWEHQRQHDHQWPGKTDQRREVGLRSVLRQYKIVMLPKLNVIANFCRESNYYRHSIIVITYIVRVIIVVKIFLIRNANAIEIVITIVHVGLGAIFKMIVIVILGEICSLILLLLHNHTGDMLITQLWIWWTTASLEQISF